MKYSYFINWKKHIMKFKLTLFLSVFFILLTVAQENASTILKRACVQANQENKNVFIIFHASWCGKCKKMDRKMNNDLCKEIFKDNYVIKHLTVLESDKKKYLETPGALEFLKKYKGQNVGIPFWLIFDKEGALIVNSIMSNGKNMGCPESDYEIKEFLSKLKSTSQLTNEELNMISKIFQSTI
jgi:thiol-disulfide isomerase/thioredoxin